MHLVTRAKSDSRLFWDRWTRNTLRDGSYLYIKLLWSFRSELERETLMLIRRLNSEYSLQGRKRHHADYDAFRHVRNVWSCHHNLLNFQALIHVYSPFPKKKGFDRNKRSQAWHMNQFQRKLERWWLCQELRRRLIIFLEVPVFLMCWLWNCLSVGFNLSSPPISLEYSPWIPTWLHEPRCHFACAGHRFTCTSLPLFTSHIIPRLASTENPLFENEVCAGQAFRGSGARLTTQKPPLRNSHTPVAPPETAD